jgi:hypothetical protein
MSNQEPNAQEVFGLQASLANANLLVRTLSARLGLPLTPSRDQVQVDVGTYQIRKGDISGAVIAELYVEHVYGESNVLIEHWGLYPGTGWVTPSSSAQVPSGIQFVYQSSGYASAVDFRRMLATRLVSDSTSVIYIQARCETMAP